MNEDFDLLDILTILSFCAQLKNIEEDKIEKDYIHTVIKRIGEEIDKLHQENDLIIEKLNKVLGENQI